ncbi:MAG: RtcB family protein [Clostridiales bacterium]|nr:RtcB family protein [Clostridiales bacterium]
MFTIEGKYNTAICYAKVCEDEAIEQIKTMMDTAFSEGSRVRIMPDVHTGAGCTIGTTMTIVDKAVPNVVGVDIGCGMYTVELEDKEIDLEKLDEVCHFIPSGKCVWEGRIDKFELSALRCFRILNDTKRLVRSLGTLGGGNHFIELDKASDGTLFLVIHSGSRNLGKQVAEYYQSLAVDLHKGKEEFFKKRDEIIRTYKEEGRRTEIQAEIKKLAKEFESTTLSVPEELCWLYGTYLEDYLFDVKICQDFAKKNRELMAKVIVDKLGLTVKSSFHTIHNYIDTEEKILRKGAIAAHKGEKVLIPINMRDGAILAVGRGNPEWNFSAPHGAGRVMSRTKAKATILLEDFKKSMEGIYTTSVNENTIDESPMAYKSLEDIIDVVSESVDVIEVIKPVFNFKASEDGPCWRKKTQS